MLHVLVRHCFDLWPERFAKSAVTGTPLILLNKFNYYYHIKRGRCPSNGCSTPAGKEILVKSQDKAKMRPQDQPQATPQATATTTTPKQIITIFSIASLWRDDMDTNWSQLKDDHDNFDVFVADAYGHCSMGLVRESKQPWLCEEWASDIIAQTSLAAVEQDTVVVTTTSNATDLPPPTRRNQMSLNPISPE